MYTNKQFQGWRKLLLLWLILAMVVLPACSLINREAVLGSEVEFQPQAQVTVDCNTACAERGQCGITADGQTVVLGGQNGPVVENHDRIFPEGTAVTILSSSEQTIEPVQGGSQSQLRFYHIQPTDNRQPGWVAGWCLATQ